jgi:adenosylcobinamide-GDP ribazoletransferase
MRHELKLFLCAVQFLTRIPVGSLAGFEAAWITRSAKYFPLVGQLVGAICAGVFILAAQVWSGWIPAILAVLFGIFVTGAFHEDGLADTADGLGGGRDKAHRLSIMKDSRIGTYGSLALIMAILLKIALLAEFNTQTIMLIFVASAGGGRALAVVVMHLFPYAGDIDAAKSKPVPDGVSRGECFIALVLGLWPLALLPMPQALLGLCVGIVVVILIAAAARRLVSGYTGDVLGAAVQLFEIGFLLGVTAVR